MSAGSRDVVLVAGAVDVSSAAINISDVVTATAVIDVGEAWFPPLRLEREDVAAAELAGVSPSGMALGAVNGAGVVSPVALDGSGSLRFSSSSICSISGISYAENNSSS